MRLAHFSDIHVTISPFGEPIGLLHGKRALGAVNYMLGRRRHFAGVEDRITKLLDDADAQNVEHVLCSGDITAMSYLDEFQRCAELFGDRLDRPERYTVIPGNHDRYTTGALEERRFERFFSKVGAPGGNYPALKRIGEKAVMVLLDVSRPTLYDSSGLCGEPQLRALEAILTDASLEDEYVIVALHYGLLRKSGLPDRPTHAMKDWRAVLALFDRDDVHLDLVLHGHVHKNYVVKSKKRTIVCAGSATDLAITCGYNVYDIDLSSRTVKTERRIWDDASQNYVREQTE
jgi:3',5'-cyclic AMP phosphodiesterase CpdA